MTCKCINIEKQIREKYPKATWNLDEACKEWSERSTDELKENNIKFKPYSDECYACTCPECGRYICGWCV